MKKLKIEHLNKVIGGTGEKKWKYISHGSEFDLVISGVKIFEHFYEWKKMGEVAEVEDPLYHDTKMWTVYTLDIDGVTTRFATGEFSNGIWGLYLEEDE